MSFFSGVSITNKFLQNMDMIKCICFTRIRSTTAARWVGYASRESLVFWDSSSAFLKRRLDNLMPAIWYLNETVWQFAAMFVTTERGNLDHKLFLALTKWFLWLNQRCHNITLKMTPNDNVKFIIFLHKLRLIPELLTHPTSVLYFFIYKRQIGSLLPCYIYFKCWANYVVYYLYT